MASSGNMDHITLTFQDPLAWRKRIYGYENFVFFLLRLAPVGIAVLRQKFMGGHDTAFTMSAQDWERLEPFISNFWVGNGCVWDSPHRRTRRSICKFKNPQKTLEDRAGKVYQRNRRNAPKRHEVGCPARMLTTHLYEVYWEEGEKKRGSVKHVEIKFSGSHLPGHRDDVKAFDILEINQGCKLALKDYIHYWHGNNENTKQGWYRDLAAHVGDQEREDAGLLRHFLSHDWYNLKKAGARPPAEKKGRVATVEDRAGPPVPVPVPVGGAVPLSSMLCDSVMGPGRHM